MTVTADAKKRIVLPDAKPGDVFTCEDQGNGHFLLVKLSKPAPPKKLTKAQVLKAISQSKMRPSMNWEELRSFTREP